MNKTLLILPWVLISSSAYHNGELATTCKTAELCGYIVSTMNHNDKMFPQTDVPKKNPKWQEPFDYDGACRGSCSEDK